MASQYLAPHPVPEYTIVFEGVHLRPKHVHMMRLVGQISSRERNDVC